MIMDAFMHPDRHTYMNTCMCISYVYIYTIYIYIHTNSISHANVKNSRQLNSWIFLYFDVFSIPLRSISALAALPLGDLNGLELAQSLACHHRLGHDVAAAVPVEEGIGVRCWTISWNEKPLKIQLSIPFRLLIDAVQLTLLCSLWTLVHHTIFLGVFDKSETVWETENAIVYVKHVYTMCWRARYVLVLGLFFGEARKWFGQTQTCFPF